MFRLLVITTALLGLILLGGYWSLQNGHLIAYAPRLPGSDTAPELEYYAGLAYFTAQNYDDAGTYFKYVFNHYPLSTYAEPAHVYWLECLGEQLYKSPAQSVVECKTFLQQYPNSPYAARVRKIQEKCETGTLR